MRWFCRHDWSKWKTYVWVGSGYDYRSNQPIELTRTRQARICLKCGKEVHRKVEDANGSEYAKVIAIPEPQPQ